MAKLKDLTITITPKMDIQKTQLMAQKFGEIFSKSLGKLGNFTDKTKNIVADMQQGLKILQEIKQAFDTSGGILGDFVTKCHDIKDLASMVQSTTEKMPSFMHAFQQGSSSKNTMEIFQKFIQNAQNQDERDAFFNIIKELQSLQSIIQSDFICQKQKNTASKREAEILKDYFDGERAQELQNIIASAGNFDKNQRNEKIQKQFHNKDTRESPFFMEADTEDRLKLWEKGLLLASVSRKKSKIAPEEYTLQNTHTESIMKTYNLVQFIEKITANLLGNLEKTFNNFSISIQFFSSTLKKFSAASDLLCNFFKNNSQNMSKSALRETSFEDQTTRRIEHGS